MDIVGNAEDQEDEVNDRVQQQLYVVTGGKQPPGYNWLSEMEEGTTFLCRPLPIKGHGKRPFLEEYHVVHQFQYSTKLMTNLNEEVWIVVDPIGFCAIMELVEVI